MFLNKDFIFPHDLAQRTGQAPVDLTFAMDTNNSPAEFGKRQSAEL